MTIPGGIRARLVLALVLIVGVAQLAAYLMVVPSLERRLVDAKLDQMQKDAGTLATALATRDVTDALGVESFVNGAASTFDARVTVLGAVGPPLQLTVIADSAGGGAATLIDDPLALKAAGTGGRVRGRLERAGNSYAEVAVPLFPSAGVMVLSASLGDQLATVRLVERSIALATVVAAAIALILGTAAAAVHARRIRRLERAANRIAVGHFDEPVVDVGDDELGQLAEAFDRMRVQLRQLDNARKEFVANASHELRTPLFSLAGFLELLADEDLDEATRREFLATTRGQVERLTKLATDLLDLSRMDAGRIRIEREDVGLAEAVRIVAEEFSAVADASGHTLIVDVDDDAWALADEERVQQIVRALTGNAIAHTPPGKERADLLMRAPFERVHNRVVRALGGERARVTLIEDARTRADTRAQGKVAQELAAERVDRADAGRIDVGGVTAAGAPASSRATASAPARSTSATPTCAPSRAKRRAIAAPMPRAPPVTSTALEVFAMLRFHAIGVSVGKTLHLLQVEAKADARHLRWREAAFAHVLIGRLLHEHVRAVEGAIRRKHLDVVGGSIGEYAMPVDFGIDMKRNPQAPGYGVGRDGAGGCDAADGCSIDADHIDCFTLHQGFEIVPARHLVPNSDRYRGMPAHESDLGYLGAIHRVLDPGYAKIAPCFGGGNSLNQFFVNVHALAPHKLLSPLYQTMCGSQNYGP